MRRRRVWLTKNEFGRRQMYNDISQVNRTFSSKTVKVDFIHVDVKIISVRFRLDR